MANDPNRDVLPVKESSEKGACDRVDPHLVARFKRPELEDRFIRLYEENNDLKRLIHIQEGKIRKLGTKLLRVLKEKTVTPSFLPQKSGDTSNDDLKMKVLELEHENYVLKDKNIVLKQQLSSHSKQHMAAHRSPVMLHRTPSSARLSQRQASVPNINEESFTLSHRRNSSELQMRDSEAHIAALNEEIKLLHAQIESLQRDLEKSAVANQKSQLGENIELIKLRRQSKQLESQLRVAEHSQKLLQQDVSRLQKENEDALQIIAEKQNEMLDVQTKLDEAAHVQLEFQELRGNVSDLTQERDALKERCEALMKTICDKSSDSKVHTELKKQLDEVKRESALLREELEMMRSQSLRVPTQSTRASSARKQLQKVNSFTQTQDLSEVSGTGSTEATGPARLDAWKSTDTADSVASGSTSVALSEQSPYDIMQQLARSRTTVTNQKKTESEPVPAALPVATVAPEVPVVPVNPPLAHEPVLLSVLGNLPWATSLLSPLDPKQGLTAASERLSLQRESECLRDMLRAQTQRCDLLENQVMRLQQELKLNEDRCKDVFHQRDLFFRLLDRGHIGESSQELRKGAPKAVVEGSEESDGCPSRNTYTKNAGTYTKSSPVESVSEADSAVVINEERTLPTEKPKVKEDELSASGSSSAASSPSKFMTTVVPVPVPRSRVSSAKVQPVVVEVAEPPEIKVSILWLQLEAGSRLLADSSVEALYVDFTILGKSSGDFETPQALPKPQNPETKTIYNFTAAVPWSIEMMAELKKVKEKGMESDVMVFNIVSEPTDGNTQDEVECPVVGMSSISFYQFAFAEPGDDILVPIYEAGKGRKCCGTLAVSLAVPPAIFKELQ